MFDKQQCVVLLYNILEWDELILRQLAQSKVYRIGMYDENSSLLTDTHLSLNIYDFRIEGLRATMC